MKIIRFQDAESYEPEPGWKRVSLCNEEDISIEHFAKPPLHSSPLHAHPNTQVLVVLSGQLAVATPGGQELTVQAGDALYIPGNQPHIVKNLADEPAAGLDVFVPGRSFDFWLKR